MVTKHNSYKGWSSPPLLLLFLPLIPRSNDLDYHWNIIFLMIYLFLSRLELDVVALIVKK
jgi:hypothetical protein